METRTSIVLDPEQDIAEHSAGMTVLAEDLGVSGFSHVRSDPAKCPECLD